MKKTFCILILAASFGMAQVAVNINTTVSNEAVQALFAYMLTQKTSAFATLTAPVSTTDTTFNVSITGTPTTSNAYNCEGEAVTVTNKTATTVTVTRATLGTTALNHSLRARCDQLTYPTALAWAKAQIVNAIAPIMAQYGATAAAQNAAAAAAKAAADAAIAAAQTTAVQ